jgi:hypothetical protein
MILLLFVLIVLTGTACQSVKPYQRQFLNDYEMQAGYPGARNFEQYVQAYREGAIGGGGSKSSGGCGCN